MKVQLIDISVFAEIDFLSLHFQDIWKKNKQSVKTDVRMNEQRENSIPHYKQSLRGL